MAENSSKLGDMTKSSLDSIKAMLDANTIIGDPIQTPVGTTIIPISKITVGYASGGIDYAKKDAPQNSHNNKPEALTLYRQSSVSLNARPSL